MDRARDDFGEHRSGGARGRFRNGADFGQHAFRVNFFGDGHSERILRKENRKAWRAHRNMRERYIHIFLDDLGALCALPQRRRYGRDADALFEHSAHFGGELRGIRGERNVRHLGLRKMARVHDEALRRRQEIPLASQQRLDIDFAGDQHRAFQLPRVRRNLRQADAHFRDNLVLRHLHFHEPFGHAIHLFGARGFREIRSGRTVRKTNRKMNGHKTALAFFFQ